MSEPVAAPSLDEILAQLEPDAKRVIAFIGARLLIGQRQYGRLEIAKDKRDWRKERDEEAADLLFYVAAAMLKRDLTPAE